MKLIGKLFLCITIILSLALSLTGYFFISYSFEQSIERDKLQAINQYQLTKFALQSSMLAYDFEWSSQEHFFAELSFDPADETASYVAIFNEKKEKLYASYREEYSFVFPKEVDENHLVYQFGQQGEQYLLTVVGYFEQDGEDIYMFSSVDITPVIVAKNEMTQTFFFIYSIVLAFSVVVILIFSTFITRPINKLTKKTEAIAKGNYSERIRVTSKDEIGALGNSFNLMAETIEKNISDLELVIEQKENFVANFAHELKTPLTSVIGYADMIYQRDLSRGEIKTAASYILNEGLRLESLSLKLMDLIVLNRQDFTLEILAAAEILENIADTLKPLCEKAHVKLFLHADDTYIKVEFDLFKTMILNFVDNSIKANATEIHLIGKIRDDSYVIYIYDNGIGIPREELNKITDAFYMIDKSRSRKQHGAGLGLALAKKIADIHRGELKILSKYGKGSCICLNLKNEKGEEDEETDIFED